MLSSFRVGAAVADGDGRIVQADDAFLELLGWDRARLGALSREAVTHPEDHGRKLVLVDQQNRDGQPFEITLRYVRADGRTVWVQSRVSLLSGEGGVRRLILSRYLPEENATGADTSRTDRLSFAGMISETAYALGFQARRLRLPRTAASLQSAADAAIPEAQG